jgi:hypothetical protein
VVMDQLACRKVDVHYKNLRSLSHCSLTNGCNQAERC